MHIWQMDEDDCKRCLDGVIESQTSERPEPKNYKEWVEKYFGPGLCDLFMIPYNEKIWGVTLD